MRFEIKDKSTVLFRLGSPTESITVYKGEKVYYERRFLDPVSFIKINFPDKGVYIVDQYVEYYKIIPLQISGKKIQSLPTPERDQYLKVKPKIKIDYEMEWDGTPAKINVLTGQIHVSERFLSLPIYAQKFIIGHEIGHLRYKTEMYCDLFSAKRMIDNGYNQSSIIYALNRTLRRSPQAIERLGFSLKNLQL